LGYFFLSSSIFTLTFYPENSSFQLYGKMIGLSVCVSEWKNNAPPIKAKGKQNHFGSVNKIKMFGR
jgi:hypothetical protein